MYISNKGRSHPLGWAIQPFVIGWRHRELIFVIVQREFAQRFRGAALGWIWAILGPLILLLAYTVVFTGPIKLSATAQAGFGHYALFIFASLVLFNLFMELFSRAPNLMRENAWFIKKTIFPSDALGWIALFRGLIYAGISFVLLLIFELIFVGSIPLTVVLVPIILVPYCLMLLGLVWFLAALGTLTQDVSHVIASIMPLIAFGSPVFYSVADIPEPARSFAYLNPLAGYMEMMRGLVLGGVTPDPIIYVGSCVFSLIVFCLGHAVFMRYRSILVDVV